MKTTRKDDERPALEAAADAADRARDLERKLAEQAKVTRQNAETWREAVHDLRGFLGVVKNSITALNQESVPEPVRAEFLSMLRESLASMNALLNDLSILANLQAGHEQRKVASFDVAALIEELCEEMQPAADTGSLFLNAQGPSTLTVQGDATKVRRIVQNLVLVALHAIKRGGVTVTWEGCGPDGSGPWTLHVQSSSTVSESIPTRASASGAPPPAQPIRVRIASSMVRCLCDLLGANLECDANAEEGNAYLVRFPRGARE